MRILHVVAMLSATGAYGGPTQVALNQSNVLSSRGHDVTVVGIGQLDEERALSEAAGSCRVKLFRGRHLLKRSGFWDLFSVDLVVWVLRNRKKFDLVHIHLSRDFAILPLCRVLQILGSCVVLQCHGMIDQSSRALAVPLDLVFTRPALRSANIVFYLTEREQSDLLEVGAPKRVLRKLRNGIDVGSAADKERLGQSVTMDVLFLARLQSRKRPLVFVDMADRVRSSVGADIRFSIVGPDEGELATVQDAIVERGLSDCVFIEGPVSATETRRRMAQAYLYVLPSIDEPFPMTVLEALSVGVPVVVTDSCGVAPVVESRACGIVVDSSSKSVADAVVRIISDSDLREGMSINAVEAAREEFSIDAVVDCLESFYGETVGSG